MQNLYVVGQVMKMFHSKAKLEFTVREYMKVLSASPNLLSCAEVDHFLKRRAFDIHWEESEDA